MISDFLDYLNTYYIMYIDTISFYACPVDKRIRYIVNIYYFSKSLSHKFLTYMLLNKIQSFVSGCGVRVLVVKKSAQLRHRGLFDLMEKKCILSSLQLWSYRIYSKLDRMHVNQCNFTLSLLTTNKGLFDSQKISGKMSRQIKCFTKIDQLRKIWWKDLVFIK